MRCVAQIRKKDTYRVNRDGSGRRFKMHYDRCQCSREATVNDRCTQHSKMGWVMDYPYADKETDR